MSNLFNDGSKKDKLCLKKPNNYFLVISLIDLYVSIINSYLEVLPPFFLIRCLIYAKHSSIMSIKGEYGGPKKIFNLFSKDFNIFE